MSGITKPLLIDCFLRKLLQLQHVHHCVSQVLVRLEEKGENVSWCVTYFSSFDS